MKAALVIFALLGLGLAAPQPRKLFHEHFNDFMDIIFEEAGDEIGQLMEDYQEHDDFNAALEYIRTANFKELVYEMESLPEFQAVVEFLENDDIDIHFFIDMFNDVLESDIKRTARLEPSGTDFSSFIDDSIALFPKEKLTALYDHKMEDHEEFRTAIENLQSEEWDAVFSALWDSPTFQIEVQTLADNGIDIHALLQEVIAIFGQ